MIPTTVYKRQNPSVSESVPLSKQVRALRMTVGPKAVQKKAGEKNQQPVNLREKA